MCIKCRNVLPFAGKIEKIRENLYGNMATTSTKASPIYNSQARDIYDENEVNFFLTLQHVLGICKQLLIYDIFVVMPFILQEYSNALSEVRSIVIRNMTSF